MKIAQDILESPGYRGAVHIVQRLRDKGFQAYVVGGMPRDLLLGLRPTDYDIATDARPAQVRALFEKTIPVGVQFGVMLVCLDEQTFEVATFRSDGEYVDGRRPVRVHFSQPAEDARRRDFTVNALMFDPIEQRLLDYVGGRRDLQARRIRTVGDPDQRFAEDYLRLIRAVRFAARLDFRIERKTLAAIRRNAPLIRRVAAERLGAEMLKTLTAPRAGQALRLLSDTGLLAHFLPEAEALRGCQQPPNFHPEGDVFIHTCLMLDAATQSSGQNNPTASVSPSLALGILLHDIAKPPTQRFTPERIRFDGHCDLGADMARTICRRLKLPNSLTAQVVYLVANHLRIKDAPQMRKARLKRFLREPGFAELLELFRLDTLASHGNMDDYEWCRRTYEEMAREPLAPPPLLRGDDLIAMGYRPGPLFKTILTAVETAQLEGKISTAEAARTFVLRRFPLAANTPKPARR